MNRTVLLRAVGWPAALASVAGMCAVSRLGADTVAAPEFSVQAGTYATAFGVELTCATPGATIRYTVNGQDPILVDPAIGAGEDLLVSGSVTLKARAWKDGMGPSAVAAAEYRITGDVSSGTEHALGLKSTGETLAWGVNTVGQLGISGGNRTTPTSVPGMTNGTQVAAGFEHSLLLCDDGTVRAWGKNNLGQLGDGTTVNRSSPVVVSGLAGVVQLAAGTDLSLALREDGTVWGWGKNSSGELGDGTTNRRSLAAAVPGLSNVAEVAAGRNHVLALMSDGRVRAWGSNSSGQLGDGTTNDARSPGFVTWLTNVIHVAAGGWHSLAVDQSGQLWAWGNGSSGGLGLGDTNDHLTATAVPGMTNIAMPLSTFGNFGMAIDTEGNLWGWGRNAKYQLGDGTTVNRLTPIRIGALDEVVWSRGGQVNGFAIRASGTLWAWGEGSNGELGNGALADQSTPVLVPGHIWSPGPDRDGPLFHQGSNGSWLVSIEAEHFSTNIARGAHAWVAGTNDAGYSGDGHVTASPNVGTNWDTGPIALTNAPRMDYRVRFVTNGTHYVWVRGRAPGGGADDTVHAGLDGVPVSTADRIDGFSTGWTWSKHTLDNNDANFSVTVAGEHTLNLWMRQDGAVIDKIILARSSGYAPSGAGTNESPRDARLYPLVSLTSPTNGAVFDVGSNIVMEASASDPFGAVARVDFFQGTNLVAQDTSSPYSVTWASPPVGTHLLSVRAADDDGMGWTAGPVEVTVLHPDSDSDGLRDDEEDALGTNPGDPDTDYDGRTDWQEVHADATSPTNAASVAQVRLGYWPFEASNLASAGGAVPLDATNIVLAPGAAGQSARVLAAIPAKLRYRDSEASGQANINLRRGTFRAWIRPDWTSAALGGTGPGNWARIVEVGLWTQDASYGDWQLAFDPGGDAIGWWSDDGQGHWAASNYGAAIRWRAGEWHQVALTYEPSAVRLYVDGREVQSLAGDPAVFYPSRAVRETTGVSFGTIYWGDLPVGGRLDEIETFNHPLDAATVAADYAAAAAADTDADGLPDAWEASRFDTLAEGPNGDFDADGISNLMEHGLEQGLVGHWAFDEGAGAAAYDASAWANSGTLYFGAGWTNGVHGGAVAFDGVDDRVHVANSASLMVGGSNSGFSAAFWLNLQEGHTGQWRSLVHKGALNEERTFSIWLCPDSNGLHPRISTTDGWNHGIYSTTPVPTNTWVHVACVVGGGRMRVYLDGRLDRDEPIPGDLVANAGPLAIGDDDWCFGTRCLMDDLRVYSRALSQGEIRALVRSAAGVPFADMALWLRADEGVETDAGGRVTTWRDSSPAGNDADGGGAATRPLLVSNLVHGLPAVEFEDHRCAYVAGLAGFTNDFSLVWVTRPHTVSNFNQKIQSPGGWGYFAFHTDDSGSAYVGTDLDHRIAPGTPPDGVRSGTVATNDWQVFGYTYAEGTGSFYKNGRLLASKAQPRGAAWNGLQIGWEFPESLDGEVAEMLLYRAGLAETNRLAAHGYLTSRYSPGDSDWDGIPDEVEVAIGLDPDNYDTDGDGIADGRDTSNEIPDAGGSIGLTVFTPLR